MPKATSQKRLNRDHARQQQRPMVEEEVIAAQLKALVTPAITAFRKLLSPVGNERSNFKSTIHGGRGTDVIMRSLCGRVPRPSKRPKQARCRGRAEIRVNLCHLQ